MNSRFDHGGSKAAAPRARLDRVLFDTTSAILRLERKFARLRVLLFALALVILIETLWLARLLSER